MAPGRQGYWVFFTLLSWCLLAPGPSLLVAQESVQPRPGFGTPTVVAPQAPPDAAPARLNPTVLLGDPVSVTQAAPVPTIPAPAPAVSISQDVERYEKPLPINLATALALGQVRALDIAIASARERVAAAQLKQANVLWLPSIQVGGEYYRHDGWLQDATTLDVVHNDRNTVLFGAAPIMVFGITDAIFKPLVARQELRSRQALVQAANNDTFQAVAEAYFNVQQARGQMAAAQDAARRAAKIVKAAGELAPSLVPTLEVNRARAEASRQDQLLQSAAENRRVASVELMRVLHMGVASTVQPLEPPQLQITLVWPELSLDALVPIALTGRPELASQQAQVQVALERWREERVRPLLPSVQLRGASTSPGPAGTLGVGVFGSGPNGAISTYGGRLDLDLQVLWQLDNLGFGYAAKVAQRRSEQEASQLELVRLEDRIVAEVATAQAQVRSAQARVASSEREVRDAFESAEKNFLAMQQSKRVGDLLVLLVRPQEALVAVQALQRAYADYYANIGDFNRAQFRLYRALGNPANHPSLGPELEKADP